ncbi:hypothetical protein WME90_33035 [Sorangium sp. So ce375]|uniref:hypothetical protein n=1 Tax=Sorangium sp. So ce375 TaxID=3133306 RepID=UPI003F5C5527
MTQDIRAADIKPTYENISAICPSCKQHNVYNRASDIGHFRAISNYRVICLNGECGAFFYVVGDLINPGHEMLLLDSWSFFREKRYIQAVLSAATAYEFFFAHFLRVELLFRPNLRDIDFSVDEIQWLNDHAQLLIKKTQRHAFEDMRRLFLRVALDRHKLTSRAAAAGYIAGLPKKPGAVLRREVESIANLNRSKLLLRVVEAEIAQLRNKVVHKDALRPTRENTEQAITNAYETIFALGTHFKIGDTDYHLNESREDAAP